MMFPSFFRRNLVGLFGLLTVLGVHVGAQESAQTPAKTYFRSMPFAGSFAEAPAGRVYGVSNGVALAIGGRTVDGELSGTVEVLGVTDGVLLTSASLSEPVAFAAAVTHQEKVYLVGGLGPNGVTDRVLSLEWTSKGLVEQRLPSLPRALMFAGLAVHRSTTHYFLEVVGGVDAVDATEASGEMFEMEIGAIDAAWKRLDPPPFKGRVLPHTLETYNEMLVLGGYEFAADGTLVPVAESWGFSRIPRDGQIAQGWQKREPLPLPMARAAYAKSGQSHLLVLGGDPEPTTLAGLLDGRPPARVLDGVWSYHSPFDVWHQLGSLDAPSAQGFLAPVPGKAEFVLLDGRGTGGAVSPAFHLKFEISTKKLGWQDWLMLGFYFVAVALIGYHFSRKQKDAESFALGNRETNWVAAAISLMASGVSTISFMALPALTACIGLANTGGMVFMLLGMFVSAHLTYPILRRLKITSTFEYIEQRFGPSLRLVGSFNSIVSQMMGRIGIVVMLPALAISSMVGIDPWISILAMGIVTTIYSAAGGFEAVIWTDVLQGILLLLGFIAIGVLALANTDGGFATMWTSAVELNRDNFFLLSTDVRIQNIYFSIIGFTLSIMAFASDQITAQRVMCIPMKHVRKLAYMGGAFGVLTAWLSAFVGMSLFGFFRDKPEYLNPVMVNDQLVPIFIVNMIPVGLAGLILATLFAAAMSTVSSSVNVCGVLVAEDFYKKFSRKVTPRKEMRVMQVVTLISGTLGTGMALWLLTMDLPTLWEAFMRLMAYIGGGFGGIFILGMFTRRTHELGAIIGVIASFGMAWYFNHSEISLHYSALGLFITFSCIAVGYVSSLIIPWKRKPLLGLTVWDQVKDRVSDEELARKLAAAEAKS